MLTFNIVSWRAWWNSLAIVRKMKNNIHQVKCVKEWHERVAYACDRMIYGLEHPTSFNNNPLICGTRKIFITVSNCEKEEQPKKIFLI